MALEQACWVAETGDLPLMFYDVRDVEEFDRIASKLTVVKDAFSLHRNIPKGAM